MASNRARVVSWSSGGRCFLVLQQQVLARPAVWLCSEPIYFQLATQCQNLIYREYFLSHPSDQTYFQLWTLVKHFNKKACCDISNMVIMMLPAPSICGPILEWSSLVKNTAIVKYCATIWLLWHKITLIKKLFSSVACISALPSKITNWFYTLA